MSEWVLILVVLGYQRNPAVTHVPFATEAACNAAAQAAVGLKWNNGSAPQLATMCVPTGKQP